MATVRPAAFRPASLYADWICVGPRPTGPFMTAGPRPFAEIALAKQVMPCPRAAGSSVLAAWLAGLAQPRSIPRPESSCGSRGAAPALGWSATSATVERTRADRATMSRRGSEAEDTGTSQEVRDHLPGHHVSAGFAVSVADRPLCGCLPSGRPVPGRLRQNPVRAGTAAADDRAARVGTHRLHRLRRATDAHQAA